MINPQQIRQGLVKLAEFKKRPHYDPVFVRDVIANFACHPLRDAILYFCETCPKEYTARLSELHFLCRSNAMIDLACNITNIDVRAILDGDMHITNATWNTLRQYFDVLEDKSVESKRKDRVREEFEHECQFDLFLSAYLHGVAFNARSRKYEGCNADVVNEAWLSFQDYKGAGHGQR